MKSAKHLKFVEELRTSLKQGDSVVKMAELFDEDPSDCPEDNDKLMKELEKKFDELFGPIDSDS